VEDFQNRVMAESRETGTGHIGKTSISANFRENAKSKEMWPSQT